VRNPFKRDSGNPYDNPIQLFNDMTELEQLQKGEEIEKLHPNMNTKELATRARDLANLAHKLMHDEL